jgi:hypothetical protein
MLCFVLRSETNSKIRSMALAPWSEGVKIGATDCLRAQHGDNTSYRDRNCTWHHQFQMPSAQTKHSILSIYMGESAVQKISFENDL